MSRPIGYKHSKKTKEKMRKSAKGFCALAWKNAIIASKKRVGDKHQSWKGDKVSYRALHTWVERNLGKPRFCEHCGNRNLRHRQYHWANISGNYKRLLTDWQRLCCKCHLKFDCN